MKKILLIIFAFFSYLVLFANSTFAQTPAQQYTIPNEPVGKANSSYPLNTNPDVEKDFRTYTQSVFIEMLSTATCFIAGKDLIHSDKRCLGIDPQTRKIGYVEDGGGLSMVLAGMIGSTYNIPVSGSQYAQYLASNFGITRTSYARIVLEDGAGGAKNSSDGFGTGIGFRGLTPVLQIWTTFRNLTYLLFVVVFILLGLGIMFRLNIDARTVMTIQNQLPRIIIALVLITLSYAIAGFLIDLMYVAIYIVIHLFDSEGLATLTNIDTNPINAVGPFGGIAGIAGPAASSVGGMVGSLFSGTFGSIVGSIVMGIIGGFIGSSIPGASLLGGAVGGIVGGIAGLLFGSKILGFIATVIAFLIISIAILSALFRVWFTLIKAYIFIFLDVIFAPFWIVGGILPGAPGGVGPWLRSLIANLSAFPVVIVLFMIGKTIQDKATNNAGNFVPPLIGDPGSNSGEAIASLIGLGIILIMPEAVNITKQTLKAPEMKYTAAVGRAIGSGQNLVSAPIRGVWGSVWGETKTGQPRALKGAVDSLGRKILMKTRLNGLPGIRHVMEYNRRQREGAAPRAAEPQPPTQPPEERQGGPTA